MKKSEITGIVRRYANALPGGPNSSFKCMSPLGNYMVIMNNFGQALIDIERKKEVPSEVRRDVDFHLGLWNTKIEPAWKKLHRKVMWKMVPVTILIVALNVFLAYVCISHDPHTHGLQDGVTGASSTIGAIASFIILIIGNFFYGNFILWGEIRRYIVKKSSVEVPGMQYDL